MIEKWVPWGKSKSQVCFRTERAPTRPACERSRRRSLNSRATSTSPVGLKLRAPWMSVQIWAPIDEKSSKQNWKKRGFLVFVYLRILNTKKIIENKKGVCWILEICVKIFGTEMVMEDLEFGKWLKEMKEWMKWLRRWSSSSWRSLYSGAPKLATEIERERDQRLKSTTVVRDRKSVV